VYHIMVSSAETAGAFNTDCDTVNLHRPTMASPGVRPYPHLDKMGYRHAITMV